MTENCPFAPIVVANLPPAVAPGGGAQYALHNNLLSDVTLPSDRSVSDMFIFSKRVKPRGKVTNQRSSGRCWLFAALNMLRIATIRDKKLANDFEFSQSYLFFWDKLERVNYVLQAFEAASTPASGGAAEPLEGRMLQFLLQDPLGDGGQWQMFTNLVDKHGLVPQSAYPETKHSGNSRGLNMVLTRKVREWCRDIRANPAAFDRQAALAETHRLLVRFLGAPPREFTWQYYEKDETHRRLEHLTPQTFYRDHVGVNLSEYVSLINDPRNAYGTTFGVDKLGNVAGGTAVKYLNMPMDRLVALTKQAIDANESVWFGSDVSQSLRSQSCVMDAQLFDIEGFLGVNFGLSKRERIEYGESQMTHAMCITGYNEDAYGHADRWEVENSWGSRGPAAGYYAMTTPWFRDNVFQIVVRRAHLTEAERAQWEQPIARRFPPWDPMGALAGARADTA